jgi:hypothetical protein
MPTILPSTNPDLQQLIYVKTNVGGWFFDAFMRVDHTSKLRITENPVETGAAIADHSFMQPQELSMEILMSDAATSVVAGQFTGGWSRSVTGYQVLRELQRMRIPVNILTRLGLYQNMLIESISAPDDYKTLYGLRVSVIFREVIIAQVQTVKVSERPQITNSTNRGNPEPVEPNQSAVRQVLKKMFGGASE